tara:strand:+ start:1891 stop:3084 length:1194 start_codon:yes stop_codon:yes gene_type:complete
MAIKLTDIVTVMKAKWTYGDKFFGYTEEFNDNHSTQYPSILITPPTSVFPEVGLNNGWEEYTFEIYFSELYNRTAQASEAIDQRWENLQDLSTEWLDNFLKHYQANAPILAFLEDESVTLERNKEVANDQLIQIKMTFTWRVLSKCFRPQSTYPNQISGLKSWIRADSNVTFSIPTQKVSVVGDGSGNTNGVGQSGSDLQPLRYTYGGASDKTMFEFDGTLDSLDSDNNFTTSLADEQFSVFEVSKINTVSNAVFGYYNLSDGSYIEMGTNVAGNYEVSVSDGTTLLTKNTGVVNTLKYHIASLRKAGKTINFNFYDSLTSVSSSDTNAAFISGTSFEQDKFRIGCTQITDGLIPPAAINTRNLDGNFQEVIIYDRELGDFEAAQVVDYLNKKYRIY